MAFQRRWAAALILLVPVCVIAGFFFSDQAKGTDTAATAAPGTITVTDLLGRQVQVRVPVPVERVILGEGRELYLVAALDTENPIQRIVGWRKDLIQADPDTYALYRQKFPKIADIPTFGGFEDVTVDVEQAIAQKRDVVFLNIEAERARTERVTADARLAAAAHQCDHINYSLHRAGHVCAWIA